MRLSYFKSEFAQDALPTIVGQPLDKNDLDPYVAQLPNSERVEASQQNLVLTAIRGYYFAKYLHTGLQEFDGYTNNTAKSVLEFTCLNLVKQAVISIATTIDADPRGRTKSLPNTLDVLVGLSNSFSTDADTVAELLEVVKASTNPDTIQSLKYVRHMRNKWAGHASLDRDRDQWADGDKEISFPLLEDALVRVINAYEELSTLVPLSAELAAAVRPGISATSLPADVLTIKKMLIDWSAVTVWSAVFRESAREEAASFMDQLTSPPNYGHPTERDIRRESIHDRNRQRIDQYGRSLTPAE